MRDMDYSAGDERERDQLKVFESETCSTVSHFTIVLTTSRSGSPRLKRGHGSDDWLNRMARQFFTRLRGSRGILQRVSLSE